MYSPVIDLPWWGYLVVTLLLTHLTIIAVTIYLHRYSAHRALKLSPLVSHFLRFWLWLTTGMQTKQWTAIHRKHHAGCETVRDPHSPQVLGIAKVLWEGGDLYTLAARDVETIERFGQGTPADWIEQKLYTPHPIWGIALMMIIDIALFGFLGMVIWTVQMMWIPFFAAGVINGIGHYWGYRNCGTEDASRNVMPWGILIGGEELHNNHHAYPASARLSSRWWEFDIGWFYICLMAKLGLARVKRTAPKLRIIASKSSCDHETLHAIIVNRYEVLARYAKMLRSSWLNEYRKLHVMSQGHPDCILIARCLDGDQQPSSKRREAELHALLGKNAVLLTIYSMRQELSALWQRSPSSRAELLFQLEDWCQRAETSGIVGLPEFARRLRGYNMIEEE